MNAGPLIFTSQNLRLEAVYSRAQGPEIGRCAVVHPHPQFGGSMDNNVVHALCRRLPAQNIGALRFNFRGVGRSEGRFDAGQGETIDLISAADRCAEDFSGPVFAAAYSFGAYVAARAVGLGLSLAGLVLISPPVTMLDVAFPAPLSVPLRVVYGDRDDFCESKALEAVVEPDTDVVVIPGADHFWVGNENRMADAVCAFLTNLPAT